MIKNEAGYEAESFWRVHIVQYEWSKNFQSMNIPKQNMPDREKQVQKLHDTASRLVSLEWNEQGRVEGDAFGERGWSPFIYYFIGINFLF